MIGRKAALGEVTRALRALDIDIPEKHQLSPLVDHLVSAAEKEGLRVDENGHFVVPTHSGELVFSYLKGGLFDEADQASGTYESQFSVIAKATGVEVKDISKLNRVELQKVQAIGAILRSYNRVLGFDREKKVDEETAAAEVRKVAEALDLELSPDLEEEILAFRQLTQAIQHGDLFVDDESRFVLSVGKTELTFHHPRGSDFMQTDKREGFNAKRRALLASTSKKNQAFFADLPLAQYRTCMAVAGLFLA